MTVVKLVNLLLLSSFASLAACRGISVQSTHDPEVDFARLQTFDWLRPPTDAPTSVSDKAMFDMIAKELEAKGLRRNTAQPDVLVAVHRSIEGTLNTKGSGYEFHEGRLRRYTLQEGTLVVDLIGAATKEAVWRGTATGAFKADSSTEERHETVAAILHDMFADYPPRR
jgi:hypothetical protein